MQLNFLRSAMITSRAAFQPASNCDDKENARMRICVCVSSLQTFVCLGPCIPDRDFLCVCLRERERQRERERERGVSGDFCDNSVDKRMCV